MNYYVGLSLTAGSTLDSGLAILDEDYNLIMVDKLYKMSDVVFFFENFSSLKQSKICVSLPWDRTLLNGKWRILSKPYQLVATNEHMLNIDNWTQRYSTRGCDFFNSLIEEGIEVNRFELYLTRQSLHLNSCYRERTPAVFAAGFDKRVGHRFAGEYDADVAAGSDSWRNPCNGKHQKS